MTTTIPLSQGFVALVDDEDAEATSAAGPWHVKPGVRTHYAVRNVRTRDGWSSETLHRFLLRVPGFVDHVNRDGLDNRRANLREVTMQQNAANRAPRRDSRSGYRGVFPNPCGRPWRAQICVAGRKQHLGLFSTPEAAAHAYDAAASAAWGEHAYLNFPKGPA